jgi:glucose/arabinose dehydrogenase
MMLCPTTSSTLRDADGDGKAEYVERYAEGFTQPYGLAWRDGETLIAGQVGVWRIPHKLTDVRSGHGEQKPAAQVPPDKRRPEPNANGQKLLTARNAFGLNNEI